MQGKGMMEERAIQIRKEASSDLALRNIADSFFDKVETMPEQKIQIDFSNVFSITRSFAHQYILRRKKSQKIITEINVPENVEKMFRILDNTRIKFLDADSMKAETIQLDLEK
jgi:STAS-like domain of unknown function (DUF4325)